MKKLISLFLALMMGLSLCACGGTRDFEKTAEEVNALLGPEFFGLDSEKWMVKGTLYEENGDPTYAVMFIPIGSMRWIVTGVWDETVAKSTMPYWRNKVAEYFEGTDVNVCAVICIDTLDYTLYKYDGKEITSF